MVCFGSWEVFLGRRTYCFPSDPNKFTFVSSDHNTFFQFSRSKRFFEKIFMLQIFFLLRYGTFLAEWAHRSFAISLLRIVRLVTGAFNSLLRSSDEKKLFFFGFPNWQFVKFVRRCSFPASCFVLICKMTCGKYFYFEHFIRAAI